VCSAPPSFVLFASSAKEETQENTNINHKSQNMNSIQKEMNNVTQTATEFFTAAKKTPLNIIDRPLNKPKKDVPHPSLEFT
jgi:hypothetical protein